MNRRIAKKVWKASEKNNQTIAAFLIRKPWFTQDQVDQYKAEFPYAYRMHQRHKAAHRIFRYACIGQDGLLAYRALKTKPEKWFIPDDQVDLKFEWLIGQELRREPLTISTKDIVPPPPVNKPAFRRDGQVHSFDALPYPGRKRETVTLKRYQVRDQNQRARPKRSVADFA